MQLGLKRFKFLFGSVLILSGCASLSARKRHQYVYVRSEPGGATILDEGEPLGTTPALVRLRRHRTYELQLQRGGEKHSVDLKTKYSWNESFFSNLIFFSLAPFGWLTDLLSGAAWTYQDPEPEKFQTKTALALKPPRLIMAPPLAETYELSDEAAAYWEKQLPKLYPESRLVPYHDTLAEFQDLGFEFDERPSDNQRYRQAMYQLKADQLFLPAVRVNDGSSELFGERKDLSGQTIDSKSSEKSIVTEGVVKRSLSDILPSWFQFIPNTMGLEFSNSRVSLSDGLAGYYSVESGKGDFFSSSLAYMQALTLSRLQLPRKDRKGFWKFQFVPGARLAYKKVYFPNFLKLANVDFKVLQFGAGIGPELGYQFGKHYIYMSYIPMWVYSQIDWDQPGGSAESKTTGSVEGQFEMGYLWFLSDRVSLRLFTKTGTSNLNLWNGIAHKVNPTTPELSAANNVTGGLLFGYTFDTRDRLKLK